MLRVSLQDNTLAKLLPAGKRLVARLEAPVSSAVPVVGGQGTTGFNGPISENSLLRERLADNIGMAGQDESINLYKQLISRSYLNRDDDGNCYIAGKPGCYVAADFNGELAKLEDCLRGPQATLETPYDESFIARKREVLRQRGIPLLTIQA